MQDLTKEQNEDLCDGTEVLTEAEIKELIKLVNALEQDAYHPYKHINGGFAEAQICSYDDDFIQINLEYGEQDMGCGHSSCYTDLVTIPRNVLLDKKMPFEDKCKCFEF